VQIESELAILRFLNARGIPATQPIQSTAGEDVLEFGALMPEPLEADDIVLAGDTDLGIRGLEWAAKTFPNLPVIYVAGNHEFYGHSSPKIDKAMRETAQALGIHFLANDAVILVRCRLEDETRGFGQRHKLFEILRVKDLNDAAHQS
jgi:hypothetical protein